jgi:hypothetical protein
MGSEDWEKSEEIARRKACIEWWEARCSFCVGQGLTGSSVFHRLKECEKGGAEQLTLASVSLCTMTGVGLPMVAQDAVCQRSSVQDGAND